MNTVMAAMRTTDVRAVGGLCQSDRELNKLKRFLRGVFIREKKGGRIGPRRSIKGFHSKGASYEFENDDGMPITIKVSCTVYKRLEFDSNAFTGSLQTGSQYDFGTSEPPRRHSEGRRQTRDCAHGDLHD